MTTCDICRGAIPEGQPVDRHTALCAQVMSDQAYGLASRVELLETAIKRLLDGNRESLEANLDALRDALDGCAISR